MEVREEGLRGLGDLDEGLEVFQFRHLCLAMCQNMCNSWGKKSCWKFWRGCDAEVFRRPIGWCACLGHDLLPLLYSSLLSFPLLSSPHQDCDVSNESPLSLV